MTARSTPLDDIVRANRAGSGVGITSVCSAHPLVLDAALRRGLADDAPVLIEATCNQVNQHGGYTGMTPAAFRAFVEARATSVGYPHDRLILGGDHLGPNPWRHRDAAGAMDEALAMIAEYATNGFGKLHLDASMACADDAGPLDDARIAERAVRLCRAAEDAFDACGRPGARPRYVIGTEVPVPGGAHEAIDALEVTDTGALRTTLDTHRAAFAEAGLESAWERVVGIVVQPGVEFGHADVIAYDRDAARALTRFADELPDGMAYEAHSTDYQLDSALRALVEDHFPILKVGPGLTFAAREALFALDLMDAERMPPNERASLIDALERAMLDDPTHWHAYYPGNDAERAFARRYSLSDRSRYYWSGDAVQAAQRRLFDNFESRPPSMALLGQYLPDVRDAVREGAMPVPGGSGGACGAADLVTRRVDSVLGEYARACGAAAVTSTVLG